MDDDKYIRIEGKLKQELKIMAARKGTSIKGLAGEYIKKGIEKENLKEDRNEN